MFAATFFDGEEWREGVLAAGPAGPSLRDVVAADTGMRRLDGVVVGAFTDHHVHLQLVDPAPLSRSTLGRVVDLGANPTTVSTLRDAASRAPGSGRRGRDDAHRVVIEYAGAFLTPPGGYPSDRTWAPAGSVREIGDADAALAAIAEMAEAGASCLKIATNRAAGPVFDDALFRLIVDAGRDHGLPVVAHAEGHGEARRARELGASRLAHAPFTERLSDDEIAAHAASVSWVSTLAIHDGAERDVAIDNVRRFAAAGGRVLYGTDMGNGPTPVGLNPGEIAALRAAGVDGIRLWRALAPQDPRHPGTPLLLLPSADADPTLARPLADADLEA